MKFMQKVAAGAALLGTLLGQPALAESNKPTQKPNISATQTEVLTQDLISRTELFGTFPHNSDLYAVYEHRGRSDFFQLRAQTFPIKHKSVELGVAGRHIDGQSKHDELGPAIRIKGKPSPKSFAKAELRYFPRSDCLDAYALYKNGKICADLLGSYNTKTGDKMLRPGIDYSIGKRTSLGLEAKFIGIKAEYVGVRTKFRF